MRRPIGGERLSDEEADRWDEVARDEGGGERSGASVREKRG